MLLLASAAGAFSFSKAKGEGTPAPNEHDTPQIFATCAAARSARIAEDRTIVQTLGFARKDDSGGQTYLRDVADSIGAFRSADGAWWRPVAHPLKPEQFGARGDGTGDDSAAINTMIRLAAERQRGGKSASAATMLLVGRYRITSPIELWSERDGVIELGTFCLEGVAPSYISGRPPEIVAAFYDRPIIAMQGMRMTVLKNFACRREQGIPPPSMSDLMNDAGGRDGNPWWNPRGLLADRQYSMAAGINIDPFSQSMPPDGGYANWKHRYSRMSGGGCKSSLVSIEGVNVSDNIVGVAIGCAVDGQLADSITFERCVLGQNKVAIAIGTDQARDCCVRNCHILGVRTMFDGSSYGNQVGVMPTVIGGVLDYCKWLLSFGGSAGRGDGVMMGTYSESLWSLGQWAGPNPLTLTACKLKFALAGEHHCARVPHFYGSSLVLLGGSWTFYNNQPHKCFIANDGMIRIDGTEFDDQPIFADPMQVDVTRMPLRYTDGGPVFGLAMKHALLPGNAATGAIGRCVLPTGGSMLFAGQDGAVQYENLEGPIATRIETVTIEKTGRGSGAFDAADPGAYLVGDYLCQTGRPHPVSNPREVKAHFFGNWPQYLGRVARIDGARVSLVEMLDDYPGGSTSIYLGPRYGAFHARSTGATIAGSNRIVDVSNLATWAVGQRLRVFADGARAREVGPPGATIVEIDQGARVIILSRNISRTLPVALLCDAMTATTGRLPQDGGAPPRGVHWSGDAYSIDGLPAITGSDRPIAGYVCVKSGAAAEWKPRYFN